MNTSKWKPPGSTSLVLTCMTSILTGFDHPNKVTPMQMQACTELCSVKRDMARLTERNRPNMCGRNATEFSGSLNTLNHARQQGMIITVFIVATAVHRSVRVFLPMDPWTLHEQIKLTILYQPF